MEKFVSYEKIDDESTFIEKYKSFNKELKNLVLTSYDIQRADAKGQYIVKKLFQAYYKTPQQLPDHCIKQYLSLVNNPIYLDEKYKSHKLEIGKVRKIFTDIIEKESTYNRKDVLMRVICDYIAGMTDAFALQEYEKLYL